MNKKVKRILIITIVFQLLVLVLPVCITETNQYIIERNAPVKGKEFTFTLSQLAFFGSKEINIRFSFNDLLEYYSSKQKTQLDTDEKGKTIAYKYKGENDWYIYGRYYSEYLSVQKLQYCEGYDFATLDKLLSEKEIKQQRYFSSEPEDAEYFKAEMSAIVYKGLIIPKAIYIDGVKVADII